MTRSGLCLSLLLLTSIVGGCKSTGDRPPGPGDAPSAAAADAAETPTGAGGVSSPTAPSPRRDSMGSAGNTPVAQREHAGVPGTSAQKPAPADGGVSSAQCTQDADCTLSRFIPGECCQDCEQRAVRVSEYEAKQEQCAEALARCPMRNCAPGSPARRASCVEGQCVVQPAAAR